MLISYKKNVFSWLLPLLFLIPVSILAQDKISETKYEWENIIPLATTKVEMEKLFGKPSFDFGNGVSFVYETKFGKLGVTYKGKNDASDTTCKWNVAPDTVIGFRISLTENIPVSKFKYDLSLFEKDLGHNKEFSYQNDEIGITVFGYFSDTKEEWISSIYYNPASADEKSKCKR